MTLHMSAHHANPAMVRDLVISTFRLNGTLVETGNGLMADIGLTTASWQVLGASGYAPTPLPVSHIARNMGLARQSVQRVVDVLADKKLVRFEANPHHQRAKLVVLTAEGREALRAAEPLNQRVMAQIGADRIAVATAVLNEMEALLADAGSVVGDSHRQDAA